MLLLPLPTAATRAAASPARSSQILPSIALLALVMLAACGGGETADQSTDSTTVAAAAMPAAITAGLATPESVLWDAGRGIWYVSNINGNPPEKDDNGYILRFDANGAPMDATPFIDGASEAITLNAPKGLALSGDTLWVADIDALRAFDVTTGAALMSVDLSPLGVIFANDVAVAEDGTVYLTDSGITFDAQGNVLHPGTSQLIAVRGGSVSSVFALPKESAANGIVWDATRGAWLLVGFNTPDIFAWTPGTAAPEVIGTGPGGGDGLLVLADGRVVFSSWATNALHVFGDSVTVLRDSLPAPADLGYDPARNVIAVPLFMENRVEFVPVGSAM